MHLPALRCMSRSAGQHLPAQPMSGNCIHLTPATFHDLLRHTRLLPLSSTGWQLPPLTLPEDSGRAGPRPPPGGARRVSQDLPEATLSNGHLPEEASGSKAAPPPPPPPPRKAPPAAAPMPGCQPYSAHCCMSSTHLQPIASSHRLLLHLVLLHFGARRLASFSSDSLLASSGLWRPTKRQESVVVLLCPI